MIMAAHTGNPDHDGLPQVPPTYWVKMWNFDGVWHVCTGNGILRVMNNDSDFSRDEAFANVPEQLRILALVEDSGEG